MALDVEGKLLRGNRVHVLPSFAEALDLTEGIPRLAAEGKTWDAAGPSSTSN